MAEVGTLKKFGSAPRDQLADLSDDTGGISCGNAVGRHVARDDGSGGDDRSFPDRDAHEDNRVCADETVVFDDDGLVDRAADA